MWGGRDGEERQQRAVLVWRRLGCLQRAVWAGGDGTATVETETAETETVETETETVDTAAASRMAAGSAHRTSATPNRRRERERSAGGTRRRDAHRTASHLPIFILRTAGAPDCCVHCSGRSRVEEWAQRTRTPRRKVQGARSKVDGGSAAGLAGHELTQDLAPPRRTHLLDNSEPHQNHRDVQHHHDTPPPPPRPPPPPQRSPRPLSRFFSTAASGSRPIPPPAARSQSCAASHVRCSTCAAAQLPSLRMYLVRLCT